MMTSQSVATINGGLCSQQRKSVSQIEKEGSSCVTVPRKKKITISLSERSVRALEELRRATDADTDSEVFRNALRLHLTLVRAQADGVVLYMKHGDKEEAVPVTLFTAADEE